MHTSAKVTIAPKTAAVSPSELITIICKLLEHADISPEERVEVLGGAFVTEAVRPFWADGLTASDAHNAMKAHDPELAEAVEALSPMLLGRVRARQEARSAVAEVESLLADTSA